MSSVVYLCRHPCDSKLYACWKMNTTPETKACENCAKAKRKCGKELPGCHRCTSRGFQCVYPPARPTSFVRLQDDQPQPYYHFGLPDRPDLWDPTILLTPVSDFDVPLSDCPTSTDVLLSNLQSGSLVRRPQTPPSKSLDLEWFLSPDSWRSPEPLPVSNQVCRSNGRSKSNTSGPPRPISSLKRFLDKIYRQSGTWVTKGSNYFIHKELYTFRTPRCIQDAQTAFALYLAKTDENEDSVFRTLDARVKQLLHDEDKYKTWSSHDVFSHLARCQAMVIYQIIGLMDGDIHLRGAAEARIGILNAWLEQLLESTSSASSLCFGNGSSPAAGKKPPSALDAATAFGLGIKDILTATDDDCNEEVGSAPTRPSTPIVQQDAVWHIWLFAESLRRTWIVTCGLHTSYQALREGWAVCMRSMKATAGLGMWDAPTSYAWQKRCTKGDIFFMEGWDLEKLLTLARPEEVDEFTQALMEATCGVEIMERWKDGALE